jgi:predicted ATPase
LDSAERALLARLGVFAGGCTLEAAEVICNPDGELGLDTFDGIASLVQQSLVRPSSAAGESRFGMLETIREYARDRLEAGGSLDKIGRRHLQYYRDLAELAEPHFLGSDQVSWLDRFEREHPNVRAALSNALEANDAESGLCLGAALWRFWFQRGYLHEGRSWLEALLALGPEAVSATRAKGYAALGGLTYWLADTDATERAYESAVRLYQKIGDHKAGRGAL